MSETMREWLSGGDRRSQAQSYLALGRARGHADRIAALAELTTDEDWLVAMRSLDLLEKLAQEQAASVAPHQHVFIGELADSDKWEIRLQIVRALPLFRWGAADRRRAIAILQRDVDAPQTFVRAWALDSLARFSETDPKLRPIVARHLRAFERSGKKALQARARHIRARFSLAARRARDQRARRGLDGGPASRRMP
jgi:hypothetical protein